MPAAPVIPTSATNAAGGSEFRAARRRRATTAAAEALVSLPRHPLRASIRQLGVDLDLSRFDIERALDALEGDGIGLIRTFSGGLQYVAIDPLSWLEAQAKAEFYWAHTYE